MHTRLIAFTLAALVLSTSLAIADPGAPGSMPPINTHSPKIKHNVGVADAVADKLGLKPQTDSSGQSGHGEATGDSDVLALECRYADAGDLLLINSGDIDLPAGARVKWEIRSADLKGYLTFRSGFDAGARFILSDALDTLDGAAPCAASPVGL